MPKAKPVTSSAVYKCDICDFKVTNKYIFKRHLHRCFTLHGIASKRSTPRHPLRVKGTEKLRTNDSVRIGCEGIEDDSPSINSSHPSLDEFVDDDETGSPHVGGEDGSISPMSSQWGVTDSPQIIADGIEDEKDAKDTSVEGESETAIDTTAEDNITKPIKDSPSVIRAKFERKYNCEHCSFQTLKSREFLYHLRDDHGEKLNVFECHTCDYASRYNNKLARHMTIHKKPESMDISTDQPGMEIKTELAMDSPGDQELKVKPLKLKRLHVKAPSVFQVSHETRPKKESQESPPIGKDVFKMVLSADGSHHYQCRDCLFYGNSAHAVKKHHSLCHNKLLQCGRCEFITTGQAEYYEHMMTHERDGKQLYIKCPDCSYVTSARSNFEKHRSFHGCDLPFKCRVCNFAADSESKIKRHMATQHTNQCASSDIFDTDPQHEVDTSWREDSLEETFCEELEGINTSTTVKQGSKSLMGAGMTKPAKGMIKFRCPHCLVVCLRRANLTRHLVAKHDYSQANASISSKNLERLALRKRKNVLSASSASPAKLKRPSAVGQDELKCSECSYFAKWPSDLRRHRQVHTMVKRFKCPMCTNKYKYLGDLNVHMRRDHLTEPQHTIAEDVVSSDVIKKSSPAVFRCPICAYSTHTKADLEQHSKQHGDIEKTFQCRLCDYQTYWRGDVGRHLVRHHCIHLSKDGSDLEKHFIFRPEIRPLTKMPMSHYLSLSQSSESVQNNAEESLNDVNATSIESVPPSGEASPKKPSLNPSGKEGQFVCNYPTCDYRTTTAERLDSHLAFHENLKQFMCPTCGKRTNWKWDIVKHMIKVHSDAGATTEDVVTLSIQEARETISDYLVSFERKPVDIIAYGCSNCEFKSSDRNIVIQHLDENHPNKDAHILSFSSVSSSGNSYVNDSKHPTEERFVEPPAEELTKYDKPFACSICKKAEMTQADVKKHYNYTHPYKEVRIIFTVDGTEFNYNTLEIYRKKSFQAHESGDPVSPAKQTSPYTKTLRPDSKYSNPKMHGYIKPFKCSVCGLRSNWKWDLKKHLRAKHPRDGGFVIMLSIEEAQMTYGKECSRSHPKCEGQSFTSHSTHSPAEQFVKSPPVFNDSLSPSDLTGTVSKSRSSPVVSTQYDPSRRQWKCSGCDYITNWRRNMARHMGRHHPMEKSKLRVIALHLLSKEEQEKILEERRERLEKQGKLADQDEEDEMGFGNGTDESSSLTSSLSGMVPTSKPSEGRLWNCPKCLFKSTLKTHIIVHMQKHEMKPFLCTVCNAPFMNRGPLHRHIQRVHERADYIKLVKVNIKYDGKDHIQDARKVFLCSLCELKFSDKSSAVEHLRESHGVEDNEHYILTNSHDAFDINTMSSKAFSVSADGRVRNRKLHHCRLCPYQSQKKAMLTFHMTYHKPTPANRYKCKYCPYYVSTMRLLHQHQRKWHSDGRRIDAREQQLEMQATPPHSPYKAGDSSGSGMGTPRRHACEKCPYTTNCKNDFFYHKQFHRPKRAAEYKCEFCDYWVVHKRLLKQHMRLHEQANNMEVSPAKSLYSDPGLVYDPVELTDLAALKQKMISAKILPSLSKSPKVSPMKLASRCAVDGKPGYVLKNGLYRKLHKCPKCPYTNIRARNMQLHVMMHGPRESSCPLLRCPYCDYYVGSKGLLSHHMKVHQKNYGDTPEKDALISGMQDDEGDDSDDMVDIQAQQKVDTLLQISRMKRFGCEKCPYASAKRQHFERHLELHGSRQRYTCQYCDYSVPSSYLLTQHSRLHLMPNQNLLSSQSINNLQHLSEVPADVALASALPPSDSDMSVTISVIHDHLGLYENSIYDPEQRKLYRCDRCPYANVRRDHLLSHLKFHMVSSSLVCPYCDYSAPKQSLLTQHIRVHFCPLPELSDWLLENGQAERESNQRNIDLAEALKVAHEYQNQSKKKSKGNEESDDGKPEVEEKENIEQEGSGNDTLICQYCEREFVSSEKLVKHELQHLIGNQFEMALKVLAEDKSKEVLAEDKNKEVLVEDKSKEVLAEDKSMEVLAEDKSKEVLAEDKSKEVLAEDKSKEVLAEDKSKEVQAEDKSKEVLAEDKSKEVTTENAKPESEEGQIWKGEKICDDEVKEMSEENGNKKEENEPCVENGDVEIDIEQEVDESSEIQDETFKSEQDMEGVEESEELKSDENENGESEKVKVDEIVKDEIERKAEICSETVQPLSPEEESVLVTEDNEKETVVTHLNKDKNEKDRDIVGGKETKIENEDMKTNGNEEEEKSKITNESNGGKDASSVDESMDYLLDLDSDQDKVNDSTDNIPLDKMIDEKEVEKLLNDESDVDTLINSHTEKSDSVDNCQDVKSGEKMDVDVEKEEEQTMITDEIVDGKDKTNENVIDNADQIDKINGQ